VHIGIVYISNDINQIKETPLSVKIKGILKEIPLSVTIKGILYGGPICGHSTWNFVHVTHLSPRIVKWLLDFRKSCTPLYVCQSVLSCLLQFYIITRNIQF
jgi:hypothetical protein